MRTLLLLPALLFLAQPLYAQIIDIAGSTTVMAFMEPAAQAYRRMHPEVTINIRGGGSGAGAASVMDGRAMLGMMSREPEEPELARMHGIERVRVGYDAVAVVVSSAVYRSLPGHALSRGDVAAIYRGEVRNWQAVGGPDRRIITVDKVKHSGTRYVFVNYVLSDPHAAWATDSVIVDSNGEMETLVQISDQAIGFLPFGGTDRHLHAIGLMDQGRLFLPDAAHVRDGSYPLSRSLYVLHKKKVPDYARDFIAFLLSAEGQKILSASGYLPVK
ncbi:substrate-binding domain-containing protein [Mariprofundus ferrooxydans]|uniref:substrate-binding domain-containing protein n=1 Tax=Mariprofundus ferrooxydans TaxID=314344 RepID=UPI001431ABF2|nr:substrate-binding domain-containing protein [Mariprofundus ferrooxydans]